MRKGSGFRRSNSRLGRLFVVLALAFSLVPLVAAPAGALDGDTNDEILFYRDDGLYRYYDIESNATLGSLIRGASNYTSGWDSITFIDLESGQARTLTGFELAAKVVDGT